jgi:hypothetical protein
MREFGCDDNFKFYGPSTRAVWPDTSPHTPCWPKCIVRKRRAISVSIHDTQGSVTYHFCMISAYWSVCPAFVMGRRRTVGGLHGFALAPMPAR